MASTETNPPAASPPQSDPNDPQPWNAKPEGFSALVEQDATLKHRIRVLRLISRVFSAILSFAAFVPLALTVHKYLSTRNIYQVVQTATGPVNRTAWAFNSKSWPTYMYFALALISVALEVFVIANYALRGYKAANRAAKITSYFHYLDIGGNIIVWVVIVSIYRYEKNAHGSHNDLWGWTCSSQAQLIQKAFAKEVQFNQYCNIQSGGFAAGVVHIVVKMLTAVGLVLMFATYWFVATRRRTKTKISTFSSQTAPAVKEKDVAAA